MELTETFMNRWMDKKMWYICLMKNCCALQRKDLGNLQVNKWKWKPMQDKVALVKIAKALWSPSYEDSSSKYFVCFCVFKFCRRHKLESLYI